MTFEDFSDSGGKMVMGCGWVLHCADLCGSPVHMHFPCSVACELSSCQRKSKVVEAVERWKSSNDAYAYASVGTREIL